MPYVPVEIVDPDGRTLTVDRTSLSVYLPRGCRLAHPGDNAPDPSALKSEWVDYAESVGIPPTEAEHSTKADLVGRLTDNQED